MPFSDVIAIVAPVAFVVDVAIAYLIWAKMRGGGWPLSMPVSIRKIFTKRIDRADYVKGWI